MAARLLVLCVTIASSAACAPSDAAFGEVRTTVADRVGAEVHWDGAPDEGSDPQRRVRELLGAPLGPDEAVQIALLNNPDLQASLDVLDVRAAQLVGASLLPNPHAEGELRFGEGDEVTVELGVSMSISDLIFLPLERGAASAALEAATFEAAHRILEIAYETRVTFVDLLAARETLARDQTSLEAAFLSYDAARRLAEAGNLNELELAQERALYEEARLAVAEAELRAVTLREEVNVLMGLAGEATRWSPVESLPEPTDDEVDVERAESRAIERSVALAGLRAERTALARRYDLGRARGIVPEVRAGVSAEREEGSWQIGPAAEIELPLFDQGQGATDVADAQLRQLEHRYRARAVEIRAAVRALVFRLGTARERVRFYRESLVPLRRAITELTHQQYNGMFASTFELLTAKRAEIAAERRYVAALAEYWRARAAVEQVLAGAVPESIGARTVETDEIEGAGMEGAGGH